MSHNYDILLSCYAIIIKKYAGNPDNITIGGQSVGGGSVMAQVISPQNAGLFQKAIVDSGLTITAYPGGLENCCQS